MFLVTESIALRKNAYGLTEEKVESSQRHYGPSIKDAKSSTLAISKRAQRIHSPRASTLTHESGPSPIVPQLSLETPIEEGSTTNSPFDTFRNTEGAGELQPATRCPSFVTLYNTFGPHRNWLAFRYNHDIVSMKDNRKKGLTRTSVSEVLSTFGSRRFSTVKTIAD